MLRLETNGSGEEGHERTGRLVSLALTTSTGCAVYTGSDTISDAITNVGDLDLTALRCCCTSSNLLRVLRPFMSSPSHIYITGVVVCHLTKHIADLILQPSNHYLPAKKRSQTSNSTYRLFINSITAAHINRVQRYRENTWQCHCDEANRAAYIHRVAQHTERESLHTVVD